jgi:hypothetical protein
VKGESEKINKMGGKGKRKKGGRRNYLDGTIMKDLSRPLITLLPHALIM